MERHHPPSRPARAGHLLEAAEARLAEIAHGWLDDAEVEADAAR